jgi:hypothetical protein
LEGGRGERERDKELTASEWMTDTAYVLAFSIIMYVTILSMNARSIADLVLLSFIREMYMRTQQLRVLTIVPRRLNTDAHNPSVKKKMSKREFIANNRGIANGISLPLSTIPLKVLHTYSTSPTGQDLPAGYLEQLYDNIIQNEIKLNVEALFSRVRLLVLSLLKCSFEFCTCSRVELWFTSSRQRRRGGSRSRA